MYSSSGTVCLTAKDSWLPPLRLCLGGTVSHIAKGTLTCPDCNCRGSKVSPIMNSQKQKKTVRFIQWIVGVAWRKDDCDQCMRRLAVRRQAAIGGHTSPCRASWIDIRRKKRRLIASRPSLQPWERLDSSFLHAARKGESIERPSTAMPKLTGNSSREQRRVRDALAPLPTS